MSIYFVRFQNMVKIGFSDNVALRLHSLQTGIPVTIEFVGHMPGDREVEAHLHSIFGGSRETGEWFASTPELESFMALMLIKDLPKRPAEPRREVHRASRIQWEAYAANLRQAADAKWPDATRSARIEHLRTELGMGARRVRSLYDNDGPGRLLSDEVATLDKWMGNFARGVDSAGVVRGGGGE